MIVESSLKICAPVVFDEAGSRAALNERRDNKTFHDIGNIVYLYFLGNILHAVIRRNNYKGVCKPLAERFYLLVQGFYGLGGFLSGYAVLVGNVVGAVPLNISKGVLI